MIYKCSFAYKESRVVIAAITGEHFNVKLAAEDRIFVALGGFSVVASGSLGKCSRIQLTCVPVVPANNMSGGTTTLS